MERRPKDPEDRAFPGTCRDPRSPQGPGPNQRHAKVCSCWSLLEPAGELGCRKQKQPLLYRAREPANTDNGTQSPIRIMFARCCRTIFLGQAFQLVLLVPTSSGYVHDSFASSSTFLKTFIRVVLELYFVSTNFFLKCGFKCVS